MADGTDTSDGKCCCSSGDEWIARCRWPLYVGEMKQLVFNRQRRPEALLLACGVSFVIPEDIVDAPWRPMKSGEILCVRWVRNKHDESLAVAVDSLDGRVRILSRLVWARHARERADREL